eukprot:2496092-Rhodomonas_salina.1
MDASLPFMGAALTFRGCSEYGAGLPSAEEELELLGRHHVGWKEGVDVRTLSDVDGSTLEEDLEGARDEVRWSRRAYAARSRPYDARSRPYAAITFTTVVCSYESCYEQRARDTARGGREMGEDTLGQYRGSRIGGVG